MIANKNERMKKINEIKSDNFEQSETENSRDDSSKNKRLQHFIKLIKVNEIFRRGKWNCKAKEGRRKVRNYGRTID